MLQCVTRSNRVLKNISKNQDLFQATREFCAILSHRQRGCKSEIAEFKKLPGNLLVTKKLQTRIPIVIGVIGVRNDTVTKNVVVRCSRGTVRGPMRLRLGSRPRDFRSHFHWLLSLSLVICHLLLAGEGPKILKIGDMIPLLKEMRRTRTIACLDPILKLLDAVISRR